jgi:hypothetical protein
MKLCISEMLTKQGFHVIWKTDQDRQTYDCASEFQVEDDDSLPIRMKQADDYVEEMLAYDKTYPAKKQLAANLHCVGCYRNHLDVSNWLLYFTICDQQ